MFTEILKYGILINIPSYLAFMYFYSYWLDLKKCLQIKNLAIFILLIAMTDAIVKYNIPDAYQDLIKIFAGGAFLTLVFKLKLKTSFLSYFISYIVWVVANAISLVSLSIITDYPLSTIATQMSKDIKYSIYAELIYIPIFLLAALVFAKSNISWKWFAKREFKTALGIEKYWHEHEKYLVPFCFVLFLILFSSVVFLNFSINNRNIPSASFYFIFSTLTCIAFAYPYFKLINDYDLLNTKLNNSEVITTMYKKEIEGMKERNSEIS